MAEILKALQNTVRKVWWEKTARSHPLPPHVGRIDQGRFTQAAQLREQGDFQGSKEVLEADERFPIDPAALTSHGLVNLGLEDHAGALADFDRARTICQWQLSAIEANRSIALIRLQQYDSAVTAAQTAIHLCPSQAAAWANLLSAYALTVQLDTFFSAVEALQQQWPEWIHDQAFLLFLEDNVDLRNARLDPRFERAFGEALALLSNPEIQEEG